MTDEIPLLHDDFERCDKCGEIVLIHGRGACLELDEAIYCPRHARLHMSDDDWQLRWGRAMELLDAVREDGSKAVKYALRHGVGHFWVIHDQDDIYQQWRRCEDDERNNYMTISESSLVRNFVRRSSIGAYVGDPPHLVDVADAPINADPGRGKKIVTDGGSAQSVDGSERLADYWDNHCSRCSDELEDGRDATLCKECSREIEMKRRERGDRCERCDGHGYIYGTFCDLQRAMNGRDTLCPVCHGSGRVPYEPDDGRLVPDGGAETSGNRHVVEGVGMETVAKCPETGDQYGPGALNETRPDYCPYCGETVKNGDHRVARRFSEVFCENTNMANWRYCPGCGDRSVDSGSDGADTTENTSIKERDRR